MSRLALLLLALLAAAARHASVEARIMDGLQVGFYKERCPQAEDAVREVVNSEISINPTVAAGIIRLFFHDCFVTGCDASLLLDEGPNGDLPEKDSSANSFTLNGLETIDTAKSTVESMCPNTVSCADILAFAARDAAVAAGLHSYDVAAGRRDGLSSRMSDLPGNMPVPGHNAAQLTELFARRGLSQEDLVVLSGAHSIGGAHCVMFANRLYGDSSGNNVDPSLNKEYAAELRRRCPPLGPNDDPRRSPKVNFDPKTGMQLDNAYYTELLAGLGLLTSDHALVADPQTRATVERMAKDGAMWQQKFVQAMQKLGAVDVLVGEGQGEVRTTCRAVNQNVMLSPFFRGTTPLLRRRPRPSRGAELLRRFFAGFQRTGRFDLGH